MTATSDPRIWWALPLLLAIYTLSAWNMVILDCDETFNYLEPLHFLVYGRGFQTWEYAPQFALRPYSFLVLFAKPLVLIKKLFGINDKVLLFKILRAIVGTFSACSQAHLIHTFSSITSRRSAVYATFILAGSSGMFVASTAFLPNTFSMTLLSLIWSFWLRGQDNRVLMLTAAMIILGWPYAVLDAIIPCFWSFKESFTLSDGGKVEAAKLSKSVKFQILIRRLVLAASFSSVYILAPSLLIERYYYGQWVLPSLNAVLYNVFGSSGGGPDVFGVESPTYYFLNLLLNFNLFFLSALLAPINFLRSHYRSKLILLWTCMITPMAVFTLQAHKEERFMFIVFPLICLFAGHFLAVSFGANKWLNAFAKASLFTGLFLCAMRSYGLIMFFEAPQKLLENWKPLSPAGGTLCMRGNWYRFPGSFYLNHPLQLGFVKNSVSCLQPTYFENTKTQVPKVNNLNKAIDSQFTDLDGCDWLLEEEPAEELVEDRCSLILSAQTKPPFRWIWVPYLSRKHSTWKRMCIYSKG